MDRTFVLGVDGGQTGSRIALAALDGTVLATARGGPADHLHEPGGLERFNALLDSVAALIDRAGAMERLACAWFGLTGHADEARPLVERRLPVPHLVVEHDMEIAVAGASLGRPAVVVLAGTGTVARATGGGASVTVGAWGYLGDEAGGFDVARMAVVAACRAIDGRGPATALVDALPRACSARSIRDLLSHFYGQRLARHEFARAARVVAELAAHGDPACQDILRQAGETLAGYAAAAYERLEQQVGRAAVESLPCYLTGGVGQAGPILVQSMEQALGRRLGRPVRVRPAELPPLGGALLKAIERVAGQADGAAVARLKDGLRSG
ncbi:MAG: BadF/BadG/BcrA/BcrD ATPase family protein [Bacillota bacterium]